MKEKVLKKSPLTQDQLVLRDNKKGTGQIPKDLRAILSLNSVFLSSRDKNAKTPTVEKVEIGENKWGWRIPLEEGFHRGLSGVKLNKIEPKSAKKSSPPEQILHGHCPQWSDYVYHPKISSPRRVKLLRRRSGQKIYPHIVFGSDDRRVYYDTGYPWCCVGKVEYWTDPTTSSPQGEGSGALIGRNAVLTSSHLVPWDDDPWMMKFTPAYYDGSSLLGNGVHSYVEQVHGYDLPARRQAFDMAVLKLYNPIGDSLGYFGARMYYDDWEDGAYWTMCGYPSAVSNGERPSYQINIKVIDDDSDANALEIEHRGDASDGNSGSPFFGWWDPGPYIIGTHSGGQIEVRLWPWSNIRINVAAGGEALLGLVGYARNHW